MITELLQKYIWLVQTFIRAGERGLSLEEITGRWEDRFDTAYSRRTFNNHREAIEDVFGIRIECNRSTNRYFIASADDISDENAESAWLINTFTVNNMLTLGKEKLAGRISVEDIPSGHRHLTGIMEAMKESRELQIEYMKYTSDESGTYTLHPYAVKEYAKRWYIVAYCVERDGLRVYGLDRVLNMKETGGTFRMPRGFDIEETFATSFGIYLPSGPGKTVKFRTSRTDAKFFRDLPVHKSQEEIASDDNRVTFCIFVCPDKNLIMEFCRYGSRIEVLSPAEVREEVARELSKAADIYK